jgi:hypothetical protein
VQRQSVGAGDRIVGSGLVGGQPINNVLKGVQLAQPLTDPRVVIGQLRADALPVLLMAQLGGASGGRSTCASSAATAFESACAAIAAGSTVVWVVRSAAARGAGGTVVTACRW